MANNAALDLVSHISLQIAEPKLQFLSYANFADLSNIELCDADFNIYTTGSTDYDYNIDAGFPEKKKEFVTCAYCGNNHPIGTLKCKYCGAPVGEEK